MSILATFELALLFGSKLMDKIPDYNQKKKSKFFNMKKRYLEEKTKNYQDRDDDLLLSLRDELTIFLESFRKEVESE